MKLSAYCLKMRSVFVLLIMILVPVLLSGQKVCSKVKLHAYQRQTLPGMIADGVVNEDGKVKSPKPQIRTTRYIFLQVPKGKKTKVIRVWISGQSHDVSVDSVKSTPVILGKTPVGNLVRNDTLVPRTGDMVLALSAGTRLLSKPVKKLLKPIEDNELVVEYIIGRRSYYSFAREIKKLEPLALQ